MLTAHHSPAITVDVLYTLYLKKKERKKVGGPVGHHRPTKKEACIDKQAQRTMKIVIPRRLYAREAKCGEVLVLPLM